MKRITSIILLLALVLSMAACGDVNVEETSPSTEPTGTEANPTSTETDPTGTEPIEESTEASTEAPTETLTEAKKENGIYGDTLVLGNIVFDIPDNFLATVIDENTYILTSNEGDCEIGLFASDVSELDEARVQAYLPMQRNIFISEDRMVLDETVLDSYAAGFDITVNHCSILTEEMGIDVSIDTTFTDSWYAYTILFLCDAGSGMLDSHLTTFVEFTAYAEYVGESPRFGFVQ